MRAGPRRCISFPSLFLIGGVETVCETKACLPVLTPFQEIPRIHELTMGVFAGLLARDEVISLARRERCDLSLAGHFEPMVIDHAFRSTFAADKRAMALQKHVLAVFKVLQEPWCHFMIKLEAVEIVVLHLTVKSHRVLIDWQQSELVRAYTHDIWCMGV